MQFKSAGDAKFFDSNRTITGGRHFIHIEMDILALKCCSFPKEQNESDQNMLFLSALQKYCKNVRSSFFYIRNMFHHLNMKYEEYKSFIRV